MNFISLLGLIFGIVVVGISAITSIDDPLVYLNAHATLVVVGGTIAAAAISFQFDRIFTLIKVFFHRVLKGERTNYVPLIQELMALADAYRSQSPQLDELIKKNKDPFVREAMEALLEGVLEGEELLRILRLRTRSIYRRYMDDALKFKALGKFPPAFGLMGAVMGMVAIMKGLGTPEGQAAVGPGMAFALIGTLYGVTVANLIILPLAENLMDSAKELKTKNTIIVEGVRLIMEKKNPILLAEELNSYLLAGERVDWREGSSGKSGGAADKAA